jgi:hypothetical protein
MMAAMKAVCLHMVPSWLPSVVPSGAGARFPVSILCSVDAFSDAHSFVDLFE